MGLESPLPQPLHQNRWPIRIFVALATIIFLIGLTAVIAAPKEGAASFAGALVILSILWMLFARSVMRHAFRGPRLVPDHSQLWANYREETTDKELVTTMETMTDPEFMQRSWRISAVIWTALVAFMVPVYTAAATLFFTSSHAASHKIGSIPPYAAGLVWIVFCIGFAARANRYSKQLEHAERDAWAARESSLELALASKSTN